MEFYILLKIINIWGGEIPGHEFQKHHENYYHNHRIFENSDLENSAKAKNPAESKDQVCKDRFYFTPVLIP